MIASLGIDDTAPGSDGWRRLQEIVATTRLPNEGYLCVVSDVDGSIVCHPEIEDRPSLRDVRLGAVQLLDPTGPSTVVDAGRAALEDPAAGTGAIRMPEGTLLIAALALPELGVHIVAQQHATVVDEAIAGFVADIRAIGFGVTVVLTVMLAGVTYVIVYRYENRLAHINENLERIVQTRTRALLQSRSAVILGLAKLAESRDDETGKHLERIRRYVKVLGDEIVRRRDDVDEEFVETIVETSSLHDIGKVGVPDRVLLKPGRLTDEQRDVIKKHPLIGGDTLLAVKQRWGDDTFLVTACEIVFAHHERWDGQGYPFGLAGDVIPLSARIVALADVYDALTTKRVYKPAMSHDEARDVIMEGAGTHFDPGVVEAFVDVEQQFRRIREEFGDGAA
jgi:response regulator RpfG family c-di-GMP phosphodiesterase